MTKLGVLGLNGSGWVFHPSDSDQIELSANATGYQLTQAGQAVPGRAGLTSLVDRAGGAVHQRHAWHRVARGLRR